MSKHDLQARPIYHHTSDSIEAHLTIVFAALAVSHWTEAQTGWSIKKFVRTLPPLPHRDHPSPDDKHSSPPNPSPTTSPKR